MLVWRRPFGDLPDIKRLRACANKRPRTTTELFSGQGLQSMSAVGHSEELSSSSLPVYLGKRTLLDEVGMSQTCHNRTHALQQKASLFDHLIGAGEQGRWDLKADRVCNLMTSSNLVARSSGRTGHSPIGMSGCPDVRVRPPPLVRRA